MQHTPHHETSAREDDQDHSREKWNDRTRGVLSQSDPEPTRSSRRPPVWLIIVAVLVVGFIVLHLSGAIK